MNQTDIYKKLNTSIKESIDILTKLKLAIVAEREAIERQNLDSLVEATEYKTKIFDQTQIIFNARMDLFDSFGIERSQMGFNVFVEKLTPPQAKRLKEEFQALVNLLEETQSDIRVNQKLIHKSKENNAKVLDILQGKKPESDLYGKTGERRNMPYQNSITKA